MINFFRKVVAGPKNRTVENGYDLDLTYITDRVIAMAYPASGLEKTYRNSIDDVSKYLNQKHQGKYMIINLSMRKYDYDKFGKKVKDYFWPDHQAPPLTTLFIICNDIYSYLKKSKDNVVVVHCNHGKGRTGTAIIAFIMFIGFYSTEKEALKFYNKRRFNSDDYGVDQPCQRRVLQFFETILAAKKIPDHLVAYRLIGTSQIGLQENNYYLQISTTSTQIVKHNKLSFNSKQIDNNVILIGDIFIELYQRSWTGDKQISRVNYHTQFIYQNHLILLGEDIKVNCGHHRNFQIDLFFQPYCQCHKITKQYGKGQCKCLGQRQMQEMNWLKIQIIKQQSGNIDKQLACQLLFFDQQVVNQTIEKLTTN